MRLAAVATAFTMASLFGCGLVAGLGGQYVAGDADAADGEAGPGADAAGDVLPDSAAGADSAGDASDADSTIGPPDANASDSAPGGDASDSAAGADSSDSAPGGDASDSAAGADSSDSALGADSSDSAGQHDDAGDTGSDARSVYAVGGTVSGLAAAEAVTLEDNGGDSTTVTANGVFTLPPVADNQSYSVTVQTQPATQVCTIQNPNGTITGAAVTDVNVVCGTPTYTVGGTVSGLVWNDTLVLTDNGSDPFDVTSDGSFTFSQPVATSLMYDVAISTQPSSPPMTCVVTNGTGSVASSNVTTVAVACTGKLVFTYTGSDQTWQVPQGISEVTVKVWGAGGGGGGAGGWKVGFPGGAGGFTLATIMVTAGQVLTVIVGQAGAFEFSPQPTYGGGGGYQSNSDNRYSGSGGGRSAIRLQGTEVVTAGGGGGGGSSTETTGTNAGGAGGGTTGQSGGLVVLAGETAAGGGGASSGGAGGLLAGSSAICVSPATIGCGVSGIAGGQPSGGQCGYRAYGGGGGGGWYGGGSGVYDYPSGSSMGTIGGGGGGSGYVGGLAVSGTTTTGNGATPPQSDPDYQVGAAVGGLVAGNGGPGLVVIVYY